MKLSLDELRKKVAGCWMGKNIGGVLGAPFEGRRQINDVKFYAQDLSGEPPANDDLDLQLVWLNAVERHGRNVNALILGEYWLSHVTPHGVEDGVGKTNMRAGIVPPLSGHLNNQYRSSCGCFIRSEIWACLAPGHPELAARYAYEDGVVDHSGEGVYGEIFCAALESAAFVESDKHKLMDIGLSYIPADCGVARGVKAAADAFREGVSWQEARRRVLNAVPGTFGMLGTPPDKLPEDIPVGERGWDAPSNVGITMLGWLYGNDDFGESLCIAVNCGEDTDCTAATLGAILGIIHGIDGIPRRWIEPMGDRISTLCIDRTDWSVRIPSTVTELTDRVLRTAPSFLGSRWCDCVASGNGYTLQALDGDALFCRPHRKNYWITESFHDLLKLGSYAVRHDFAIFSTVLEYLDGALVRSGSTPRFRLTVENNLAMQQWLTVGWHVPAGWNVLPAREVSLFLDTSQLGKSVAEFELAPGETIAPRCDLVLDIVSNGRPTRGLIPVTLLHGGYEGASCRENETT